MSTVLADSRLGVIVSDTNYSDGDTRGQMRKVWRIRGSLIGLAGHLDEMAPFLHWIRMGMPAPHPKIQNLHALILNSEGLLHFAGGTLPILCQRPFEAIGTGAMAAKAAHQALGFADPRKAVRIVCGHDNNSRTPVRLYKLKG